MPVYPELVAPILPTVLQRIGLELEARIQNMKDEDNGQLWNRIFKGPVQTQSALTYPVVGVEQTAEQVMEHLYPMTTKIVSMCVDFKFQYRLDVDSYTTFRYYLGKLQQRLFGTADNLTLGGLSIDVQETGSNPEIESPVDPSPGGIVLFQVYYRHWTGDPYHTPAETPNYVYGQ